MNAATLQEAPPTDAETLQPLTVDAKMLATMLGLCKRTIRSMDAGGKLPKPIRLSARSVRWAVAEIEAWLQAGAPDRLTWENIKKVG